MNTEISDSLCNNLESIQLKLTDFGFRESKTKVINRMLNRPETVNINDKVQNIDDNHFSYTNPVCPHCFKEKRRDHVIYKGFRKRKIRIDGTETLNPYNDDDKKVIRDTIHNLIIKDVMSTLNEFGEDLDYLDVSDFVDQVKFYEVGSDKNITVYLRKYYCKTCGHYFQTELSNVYDRYKRYAKSFFTKLDELISYKHYNLSGIQNIFKTFFKREINIKTIYDWTKIKSKIARTKEYNNITYLPEENMIINQLGIGSGIYSHDEQYLTTERKDTLRFTLTDAILNISIAEQIIKLNTIGKWKISKADVKNFIKKATKNRKFHVLITDGRAMYKSIAKELNVEHQYCIFHAIYNNNKDVYDAIKSKTIPQRTKIEICTYTSQINEILRSLSLHDAKEQLNEMLEIRENKTLPPQIINMIKRTEKNFHQLTTHLRITNVPRTNNPAELANRTTMPDSTKRIYKTTKGILTKLITNMKNKTLQKVTAM